MGEKSHRFHGDKQVIQKVQWNGTITSIQPRIRLTRSFDQSSHTYLGYLLRISGVVNGRDGGFLVGIGKAAQEKHRLQAGDTISGESQPVADRRTEVAEYYKTSKIKVLERSVSVSIKPPPWLGIAPDLPTYRQRGHRRLEVRTSENRCCSCIWGCRMPVEMIIDHWDPNRRRY